MFYNERQQDYIISLYRLAVSNVADDRIEDWFAQRSAQYSKSMIKRTLVRAQREDLIDVFIQEEDITLDDVVKSRLTAREGTVVGIHNDGDTIDVKWDAGGVQALSKEQVYKLTGPMPEDFKKVTTTSQNLYADMKDPQVFQRPDTSRLVKK